MRNRIRFAVFTNLCAIAVTAGLFLPTPQAHAIANYLCQTVGCTGTVNGIITGTQTPCSCALSGGTPSACVFVPGNTCSQMTKGDNNCTGTVVGNPLVNCYLNFPFCSLGN